MTGYNKYGRKIMSIKRLPKFKRRRFLSRAHSYRHTYGMAISKTIGFPESMQVRLRYDQTVTHTSASTQLQIFAGNGPYDPDVTGSGNQPNYFDNYTAIYGRYRCLGSTIRVQFYNASSTIAVRTVVMPSDVVTAPANVMNAAGNPYAKLNLIGTSTSGNNQKTISNSITTARINGKSKSQIEASDTYQSLINTVPADLWYWFIQTEDLGLASAQNLIMDVSIIYTVQFTDKINQNLS